MIHGTTEIFAICISGAAGIRIGMAIAFPGPAVAHGIGGRAGRTAATAMVGTVIMLAVAGLLEGVGRQTILNDGLRTLIGGAVLAGWLSIFTPGASKALAYGQLRRFPAQPEAHVHHSRGSRSAGWSSAPPGARAAAFLIDFI